MGLAESLKANQGKSIWEVGGSSFSKQQIQQRRASEEKPISVNSDFVSTKDTNPPSSPHFFSLLFFPEFFSLFRYVILIS
jgi:hypothetical protein